MLNNSTRLSFATLPRKASVRETRKTFAPYSYPGIAEADHRQQDAFGGILHIEEFSGRRTGAPGDDMTMS